MSRVSYGVIAEDTLKYDLRTVSPCTQGYINRYNIQV